MIIRLGRHIYPLVIDAKWLFRKPTGRCSHGPQNWSQRSRFKPLAFAWVKLGIDPSSTSTGRRLWIYTAPRDGRGSYGRNVDFLIDRRPLKARAVSTMKELRIRLTKLTILRVRFTLTRIEYGL